jgi:hypothetical protein
MADFKTYRHEGTGHVNDYPVSVAAIFPELREVAPGSKPLAYLPLNLDDRAEGAGDEAAGSSDDNTPIDNAPDSEPAPNADVDPTPDASPSSKKVR